jgi:hypothetical protein
MGSISKTMTYKYTRINTQVITIYIQIQLTTMQTINTNTKLINNKNSSTYLRMDWRISMNGT